MMRGQIEVSRNGVDVTLLVHLRCDSVGEAQEQELLLMQFGKAVKTGQIAAVQITPGLIHI